MPELSSLPQPLKELLFLPQGPPSRRGAVGTWLPVGPGARMSCNGAEGINQSINQSNKKAVALLWIKYALARGWGQGGFKFTTSVIRENFQLLEMVGCRVL